MTIKLAINPTTPDVPVITAVASRNLTPELQAANHNMYYCFISDDNKPIRGWQSCKDMSQRLLRDYVHLKGTKEEKPYRHWNNALPNLSDLTRLLVSGQLNMRENLEKGMDMLHQVERDFKLTRSRFDDVEGDPNLFLVEGSRRWMIAPPMINLYIFLIRNLRFHSKGQSYEESLKLVTGYDKQFVDNTLRAIAHIKDHKYWKVFDKEDVRNYLPLAGEETIAGYANAANIMGADTFGAGGVVKGNFVNRSTLKAVYEAYAAKWIWPEEVDNQYEVREVPAVRVVAA